MADPGFSVGGGADLLGGANLRHVRFSVKTNVKTKELDPVGGARAGGAPWIRQCTSTPGPPPKKNQDGSSLQGDVSGNG